MKGILSTTLSFVTQSSQKQAPSPWRSSNLNAFYLTGQGAVFMIPTSSIRAWNAVNLSGGFGSELFRQISDEIRADSVEMALQATEAAIRGAARGMGQGTGQGTGRGTAAGAATAAPSATPAQPAPPSPPALPAPPAPPAPPQVNREELRKKVDEYQAKAKKSREEAEASREKFLQNLAEVKVYLIEALANYGDSLTTIRPGEYINLVLITDDFVGYSPFAGRQRARCDVISAQKSWITDYKAGRLNLDGFKQKVLQYTQ